MPESIAIDGTPDTRKDPTVSRLHRRRSEIDRWLQEHPAVTNWTVLDDERLSIEPILAGFGDCVGEVGISAATEPDRLTGQNSGAGRFREGRSFPELSEDNPPSPVEIEVVHGRQNTIKHDSPSIARGRARGEGEVFRIR